MKNLAANRALREPGLAPCGLGISASLEMWSRCESGSFAAALQIHLRQLACTAYSLANENTAANRALREPGLAPCGLGVCPSLEMWSRCESGSFAAALQIHLRKSVCTAYSLANENLAANRALREPGLAPCGLGISASLEMWSRCESGSFAAALQIHLRKSVCTAYSLANENTAANRALLEPGLAPCGLGISASLEMWSRCESGSFAAALQIHLRQLVCTAYSLVNENTAANRALREPGLAPCGLGISASLEMWSRC